MSPNITGVMNNNEKMSAPIVSTDVVDPEPHGFALILIG
jgi:hypothetical protein